MPLSEEMPTPAKLESDLDRTEVRTWSFLQTNDSEKLYYLNIIRWQSNKTVTKFPNLSSFGKNTTAVKSLFANYSL